MSTFTRYGPTLVLAHGAVAGPKAGSRSDRANESAPPRRRGRPPLATPDEVLEQIRRTAAAGSLFRVHHEQPALYARARRLWGTWAGALRAAGIDYLGTLESARKRAAQTRRTRHMARAL